MTSRGAPHFFALPDREDASAVARRLQPETLGLRVLYHPSGRPWIIGRWADEDIAVARTGTDAVALIGMLPKRTEELARRTGKLQGSTERLQALSAAFPGSFHVVGSVSGALYVQGTAYGMRRVHHTVVDGCPVAGDRAVALADLAGAEMDLTALAMRLPEPLAIQLPPRSMWRAVTDVAPGACLIVPAGRAAPRHVRWHTPPAPVRTAADGAAAVREALAAAVTVRTERDGLLSADLSGGLDSTTLCSFAAGQLGAGELIVGGIPGDETISDDAHYARLAAAHWPHVEHVELTPQQTPLFYRGIVDDGCRTDIPAGVAMSRGRATAVISLMARRGSRLHMTGHGGDHLFFQSGAYCHDLIARRPLLAWQRIRGYRTLYGWRWRPVLRQLADRRSYRRAVAGMDLKTPGDLGFCTPQLAWVLPPVVQPWLTAECRELVTAGLREAAERAEPYAPTLGRHRELSALYTGTQECAAIAEAGRRAGVPVTMPYFDDAVVDAALSVRPEDRTDPWQFKPVLKEAVRGVLPEECRVRVTKFEGTVDAVAGLYRHRDEIRSLWEDSTLAKAGLVDAESLSRLTGTPGTPAFKDGAVDSTIICEAWLRAVA